MFFVFFFFPAKGTWMFLKTENAPFDLSNYMPFLMMTSLINFHLFKIFISYSYFDVSIVFPNPTKKGTKFNLKKVYWKKRINNAMEKEKTMILEGCLPDPLVDFILFYLFSKKINSIFSYENLKFKACKSFK